MKRLIVLLPILFLVAAQDFNIDVAHSSVGFVVSHMVVSRVPGDFKTFEGKIKGFDGTNLESGAVELSIDAASIDTRDEKRNEHLKSPDFFDVAKFPKITFKSKKVIKGEGNAFKLIGDLTIREVTKEITLECTYNGKVDDPWGFTRVGFTATGRINRQDYGVSWSKALDSGGLVAGNDVDILIQVEAARKKS